ncbi:hypothetical protein QFC22_000334 [Naganishia vaughanmartiniae]|uniref:Uncharacterized protein n=1 Tax=Naganishia vaughanmartiniae TaxID=1424756 RepID=A0ACC2XPJ0_9TREE|nr:hypothetical protein QFC22_000334 [Naganishia vaughanmartiniae]
MHINTNQKQKKLTLQPSHSPLPAEPLTSPRPLTPPRIQVLSPDPIFINSQEIPPNTWYPLYGDLKAAIWSPLPGGRIEVSSAPSTCYDSSSSTIPFITSLHLALERRRILARRSIRNRKAQRGGKPTHLSNGDHTAVDNIRAGGPSEIDMDAESGPRLMVLGPANAGKSTVLKNLVNLALGSGMGWAPAVVSLDPSNSPHLLPGSVSLSTPTQTLPSHHPSHFLGSPPTTSAATTLASDVPTLGWYIGTSELSGTGGTGTRTCFPLWRKIVASMQDAWEQRREKDEICRSSGLFIDTPSSMTLPTLGAAKGSTVRYGLVREVAEAFDVDVLIVIGNEKLTIEMQKLFSKNGVTVISAPKSGGVVELDDHYRNRIKSQQTKTYFYGEPPLPPLLTNLPGRMVAIEASLHPHSFTVSWDDLEIYRIGEETAAPSSALPMGSTRALSATRLTRVDPSAPANVHRLHNAVLGLVIVSDADKREDLPPRKVKTSGEAVKQENGDATPATTTTDAQADAAVKEEDGKHVKTEDGAEADDEEEDEDEEPIWKEEIGWREVCGFLTITKIDTAKRKYELLTPSPGRLPSRVAIAGSVEWIEES